MKTIKSLKVGDYFTLKDYDNKEAIPSVVWIRGEYVPSMRSYSCYRFNDVCHEKFFKGSKSVYVDMIF